MQSKYYLSEHSRPKIKEEWEVEVIPLLEEMLQVCGEIFELQIDLHKPGSNFYPSDATKEEVLEAAKTNEQILSPYTIVTRSADSKLESVPYNEIYSDELKKIIDIASRAIEIAKEPVLKGYLEHLILACKDNSWEELENYWLRQSGNRLDLQLAPVEPYTDRLLNIKHAFQGSIRYSADPEKWALTEYIEIAKAIKLSTFVEDPIRDNLNIDVRVESVIASAGYHVLRPPSGSNYPNNADKVLEYGSKVLIYSDRIAERNENVIQPIMKAVLDPDLFNKYTYGQMSDASVSAVVVHEISEAMLKFSGSVQRLKDYYIPVKEIYSSLMGSKLAAIHVLQGALSHQVFEAILISEFIGYAFYCYQVYIDSDKTNVGMEHYLLGFGLVLRVLEKNGALEIKDNKIYLNVKKMYTVIDDLTEEIERLKAEGSYEEAKELFGDSTDISFFEQFKVVKKSS